MSPASPQQRRSAEPRLSLPPAERVRVNEIFYSLQGEASRAGLPCVMVRLTGCQMRCVWCDSEHSFHAGTWMTVEEVLERTAAFGCGLVEVTGGEPLLQPGCSTLLGELCDGGYEVLLETGGGLDIGAVDPRVRRIVDVKCPGSGEHGANRWENLDLLTDRDELKLVLADEDDYLWARDLILERGLHRLCPVWLSPVHDSLEASRLAAWILRDRLPVRLGLQLHKLLWGDRTRGV